MTGKIMTVSFRLMRQDEIYGFLNDVSHQITGTFSEVPDCAKEFLKAQCAYEEALQVDDTVFSASDLAAADREADGAWTGLNMYLKAMRLYPRADVREAAEQIWNVFSRYDNPTSLAYATEYGLMERMLTELHKLPESVLEKANAVIWIKELDEKCSLFIQMYALRIQEKAGKVSGASKTARLAAIEAYRRMVAMIEALLLVSPTEEIERFAGHLNELIANKQIVFKSRQTKATSAET